MQFDDITYCSVELEYRIIHWQECNSTNVGYIIKDIGYCNVLAFCKPYIPDKDEFDDLSLEILKLKDLKYNGTGKIFVCFDDDVVDGWIDWFCQKK